MAVLPNFGMSTASYSVRSARLLMQGMSEKGIDQLRADLAAVDADCAEQIRKTVHDNYHHFIRACQVCTQVLNLSHIPQLLASAQCHIA